jgi:alpha-mannosidase
LIVHRTLSVPAELDASRDRRSDRLVSLLVETEARLVPGARRADLRVRIDNHARDHRLRLLFPTGTPAGDFLAATTFDVARRSTQARDASRWVHPAPTTFPQQGFVSANGLTVAAPGVRSRPDPLSPPRARSVCNRSKPGCRCSPGSTRRRHGLRR